MRTFRDQSGFVGICVGLLILPLLFGCGQPASDRKAVEPTETQKMQASGKRDVIASNAFFYYRDLPAAERFYRDILGLRTVADYGFAKIIRIARTSYLTLVDAQSGMHRPDEPKTVAIALITDQLDEWYEYLRREKVPMRSEYKPVSGRPHHGFVAYDPEGYFLEFERFNPHPENERLLPILSQAESIYPEPGASTRCPAGLGFKATVLWLYYKDMENIQDFWGKVMGFEQVVDQGWAKIYAVSPTGFVGPVDGTRGMHSWTETKCVTVSFITNTLDEWFAHLRSQDAFKPRTPAIEEEGRAGARVFVGYDPEGYYLEFDSFLDTDANKEFLALLKR